MKTKNRNFLISAVLMGIAMMLTACAVERDNPAWYNPLGDKIYGLWYADYQESGIVGVDKTPYSRVVQAVKFNADGTGTWWKAMFGADDASKPLWLNGGRFPVNGTFDYSVAADGTIRAKRRGEKNLDGSPMTLVFHYQDGAITFGDDGAAQTMQPAPKDYDNLLLALESSLLGAEMVDFNINDGEITAENWRQTEGIYIYDGKGTEVKDKEGRTGYTLVALPWYEGTKLVNLPNDFCDDITPDNGWEWVANFCGNRSIENNNFFAVYNKYTGILRFFYYLPEGYSTGNDHVWQVSMTDNLATRTTIPYGVPNDRTLKDKGAINQVGSDTFMDYVTPWTDYKSDDGLIVPNAGWWAFDVDLSMTRPETFSDDNNIKLQMRSWDTSHTTLYSTMEASIDGEMKGTFEGRAPFMASSSKGLFGRVGDFIKLGTKVKDVYTNLTSGNVVGAFKGGVDLAKNGSSLASSKTKASGGETIVDGSYQGTINLMMNGTINTDGVIKGSAPTVGITSPTLYLKDFDTKNSHLGQGVWNLKKTPVMYRTNYLRWDKADYFLLHTDYTKDDNSNYYVFAQYYFFDPSSIEVELNPNVFPDDQIEWMQVDAVCGVRKSMLFTGTDPYLKALDIKTTKMDMQYVIRGYDRGAFNDFTDFYYREKGELKKHMGYPYVYGYSDKDADKADCLYKKGKQYDFYITWLLGRGADNYAIEPAFIVTKNDPDAGVKDKVFKTPAYEVSVNLTIKLKGVEAPFVFSRIYLPEIKNLDIKQMGSIVENAEKKTNLSPKTAGHTGLYDMQVERLKIHKGNWDQGTNNDYLNNH